MKKKFLIILISAVAVVFLTLAGINIYIVGFSSPYIISAEEAIAKEKDCVLVLGAGVFPDGTPCDMLYDRIKTACDMFDNNGDYFLLLSGDSENPEEYDEITAMKKVSLEMGINEEKINTDEMGLNTFSSMKNMKEKFNVKKAVIVTQKYHLYRSVYLARKQGVDAYGINSDPREYQWMIYNNAREFLARIKAFYMIEIDKK